MAFNLCFLSSIIRGLHSSKKHVKMFEYFKGQIVNNGIIFLQEMHSSEGTFNDWRDNFKGEVFFFTWHNKFLQCDDWLPW